MNSVTVSGNLTRDPELITTASGIEICKFGIAVNERRKVDEEWTDVAHFFDVTYFGRRGELMAEKANKGDRAYVTGRLEYQSWEDKESGQKRSKVGIIANEVEGEFVFRAAGSNERPVQAAGAGSRKRSADDDIPF